MAPVRQVRARLAKAVLWHSVSGVRALASPHESTANVRVVPITPTSVAAHVAKLTGNPTMSVVGDLTDEAVVTKLTAQITAKFG